MPPVPYRPVPLVFEHLSADEQHARLAAFHARMVTRRTVRHYSDAAVSQEVIDRAIAVAGSAPSGANLQPWRFIVVRDPGIKRRIREAAEEEEREFYERRAPEEWLEALAPLGTGTDKAFLETAPCLIVVFRQDYGIETGADGSERHLKHYYASESTGIACGFLLAALHVAGLATLTHTPSPMGFLSSILERPKNEKPFLLIPVGYPAPDAVVPSIAKKPLDHIRMVK
ncbi:MAG: nitroreductase family protein [Acidobacteria bacterium]|nr:nitroreductase family protein [Acidobacteriota bacterium]